MSKSDLIHNTYEVLNPRKYAKEKSLCVWSLAVYAKFKFLGCFRLFYWPSFAGSNDKYPDIVGVFYPTEPNPYGVILTLFKPNLN